MRARVRVLPRKIKRTLGLLLIVVFILQFVCANLAYTISTSSTVIVSCTVVSVIEVTINPDNLINVESNGSYQIQIADNILTVVPL